MTELSDKMRALAATGHKAALDLCEKATALDTASAGFYAEPQTVSVQSFLGAWARARQLWCDCTGEPLV